ncbi:MAG: fatty acid CoA ligase family protein [Proteobacteria bacterium]|nr:fatty acid CoA ligase family protein [Pseudomonadota bacterium]
MPANYGNIAAHLTEMAKLQPSRPAVICANGRDAQGAVAYDQLSFGALDEASSRLAHGLESAGIGRGVRTALMVPPSLDFFTVTFALFKAGAVPVLIDPGIGLAKIRGCLAQARPEAFIGIPKAHAARVVLGWARDSVRIKVTAGSKWFWGGHTLQGLLERADGMGPFAAIEPEPDETAAILFTSGSTGAPKGAVYTHAIFGAQVEHIRRLYGIAPGEMDLATFPLFALFGPALGMTAVVPAMDASRPASVDPANIVSAIEKFGITNMFGSPALINRVGRYGEGQKIGLPSLRRAISAGAPVPAKVLARFASMLSPGAQVFTPYGATECLPVASIGSDEVLKETRHRTDAGAGVCVGRSVPGLELKVIRISDDPIDTWSDALELPAGEIGEIAVKAAHATRSYFELPQATALAKIQDPGDGGFYHRMGDVGYVDSGGRLWFCGRKAHRVAARGLTRFSIPCEGVFNAHPKVYRTALVGVVRNGVIEPVLCVELEAGARGDSQEAIRDELRRLGAGHEHTRDIDTFLFHPAFPVDVRHNAKIFREKLAVWAAKELAGAKPAAGKPD